MMKLAAILLIALVGMTSALPYPTYETTTGYPSYETTTGYPSYETTTGYPSYETTTGYSSYETTTEYPSNETTKEAVPVAPVAPVSLFPPLPVLPSFGVSPYLFNPLRQLFPFGFLGRKKRSVDAMEMPIVKSDKKIQKEEETPVRCWYKDSKIECVGQEKPISCKAEQRLSIIKDLKSIRLPSLIMEPEIIQTGVGSKTTQVIDLISQRSMMQWTLIHPKRLGKESQILLSIYSADIERPGFFVKEPECFDKITRAVNENGIRGIKFSLVIKQD